MQEGRIDGNIFPDDKSEEDRRDDWKKLRRFLSYLKRMFKLPLILRSERVNVLKWWVDASYAAHDDLWVHIGGTGSIGKEGRGSIISISKKES